MNDPGNKARKLRSMSFWNLQAKGKALREASLQSTDWGPTLGVIDVISFNKANIQYAQLNVRRS
ncbi:MAG: hypothetical protein DYH04_15845 [Nitrospira sp. NTP2]|nr:hypothetical protein [Nitrospira sp. NTP2]